MLSDRPVIVVHLNGLDWRVSGLTSLRHTPLDAYDEQRGVVRYVPEPSGEVTEAHRRAAYDVVYGGSYDPADEAWLKTGELRESDNPTLALKVAELLAKVP